MPSPVWDWVEIDCFYIIILTVSAVVVPLSMHIHTSMHIRLYSMLAEELYKNKSQIIVSTFTSRGLHSSSCLSLFFEIALYIWEEGNGPLLTAVPEFCTEMRDNCATSFTTYLPNCVRINWHFHHYIWVKFNLGSSVPACGCEHLWACICAYWHQCMQIKASVAESPILVITADRQQNVTTQRNIEYISG